MASPSHGVDPLAGTYYRAIARVSSGSLGDVYRAERTDRAEEVGLLLLHPEWARYPDFVARLHYEAQTLSALHHPNSMRLSDAGQAPQGQPFFAFEPIAGPSLSELVRQQGFVALPDAVRYVRQVLSALEAVHARGLSHRDLVPESIFLGEAAPAPRRVRLLALASPRPLAGPNGVTSDIYAAGALLYVLISGRAPDAQAASLSKSAPQAVPAALEQIVLRAMQSPEQRFQSVSELDTALAGLERLLDSGSNRVVRQSALNSTVALSAYQAQSGVRPSAPPPAQPASTPPPARQSAAPRLQPETVAVPSVQAFLDAQGGPAPPPAAAAPAAAPRRGVAREIGTMVVETHFAFGDAASPPQPPFVHAPRPAAGSPIEPPPVVPHSPSVPPPARVPSPAPATGGSGAPPKLTHNFTAPQREALVAPVRRRPPAPVPHSNNRLILFGVLGFLGAVLAVAFIAWLVATLVR